jgi:hypothetical protein
MWLMAAGCGGGSSAASSSGALSGNWQLNLVQNYPSASTPITLSASGFVTQSSETLSGSIQGPNVISATGLYGCSGVGQLSGTVSGQTVTFSLNPGGSEFDFTGAMASDSTSISGTYEALGGGCIAKATSGTFTASLIPALNGAFTGQLTDSSYMALLGDTNPISVTGSFTQSSNAGASNATITGTISATDYPCFETAYLTGTISGQSVYLDVYDFKGEQIGTLGLPSGTDAAGSARPATVSTVSDVTVLTGNGDQLSGLSVGQVLSTGQTSSGNPCPPIGPAPQSWDAASVCLAISSSVSACQTQQ